MKRHILAATIVASLVAAGCLLAVQTAVAAETAKVEVAFSPDGGAESLVIGAINGAQQSIRLMAYSFTAEAVVRALVLARRRGVDVAVSVDYRNNIEEDRSGHARAALGALTYARIPVRVVSAFPLHHDNRNPSGCYIVVTSPLSGAVKMEDTAAFEQQRVQT